MQQCDNVCHSLATGRRFSPGTPVSSTNITDRHDITEIMLVAVRQQNNKAIGYLKINRINVFNTKNATSTYTRYIRIQFSPRNTLIN
jgi:hypothetical protein